MFINNEPVEFRLVSPNDVWNEITQFEENTSGYISVDKLKLKINGRYISSSLKMERKIGSCYHLSMF